MQPSKILRVVVLGYSGLYALFVAAATFSATRSLVFSNTTLPSFGLERSLVYLLFALFLGAVIASFRSELGAGVVFAVWFALLIWMDAFSLRYGMGGGMELITGAPGLIFGCIYLIRGFVSISRPHSAQSQASRE